MPLRGFLWQVRELANPGGRAKRFPPVAGHLQPAARRRLTTHQKKAALPPCRDLVAAQSGSLSTGLCERSVESSVHASGFPIRRCCPLTGSAHHPARLASSFCACGQPSPNWRCPFVHGTETLYIAGLGFLDFLCSENLYFVDGTSHSSGGCRSWLANSSGSFAWCDQGCSQPMVDLRSTRSC
jgi:hypothetical protein